ANGVLPGRAERGRVRRGDHVATRLPRVARVDRVCRGAEQEDRADSDDHRDGSSLVVVLIHSHRNSPRPVSVTVCVKTGMSTSSGAETVTTTCVPGATPSHGCDVAGVTVIDALAMSLAGRTPCSAERTRSWTLADVVCGRAATRAPSRAAAWRPCLWLYAIAN